MRAMPNRIFLIGYMGSGKTAVAEILSRKTGAPWIDMDREIENAAGMPIRSIFIKYGEHEFRNKEAELLDKLCNISNISDAPDARAGESADRLIVSCGGGIILDDLNRKILNRQYTIFLEADPAALFERVNGDVNRPFAFMDVADKEERRWKFLDLYKKREPLYKEASSVTIQTDGKNPEQIAAEILTQIKNREL